MTNDHQIEIDEDSCLALTGDAEQCGNRTDTDASGPEAGLCGVHAGTDRAKVTDFAGPAWAGLRDDLVDLVRSEREAYALATLTPDLEELWTHLTGLEELQIGDVEFSVRRVAGLAREVGQHPDLDVDDHPFGYDSCIALQGRSAKNDTCPNSSYGAGLLCGMHQEADLPGTILDEGEDGPDLETVTVDGEEYQLVEQRDDDLIVVDTDEWELHRLAGVAGDETRWDDQRTTPELSDDLDTLVLVGCGDAKADEPKPAKELYTSVYFDFKRQYAEQYGDEWAVLSAKFGLLDPEVEIEPYDLTIEDVDAGEWNLSVLRDLPDVNETEVVLLAGPDYVDELQDDLSMYGAEVSLPTEGKKIGKRVKWLSQQVGDAEGGEDDVGEELAADQDADREEDRHPRLGVAGDDQCKDDEANAGGRAADYHAGEATADGGTTPTARPEAPSNLPKYMIDGVEKQSPEDLRDLAAYAERMAEWQEAEAQRKLEERSDQEATETPEEWDDDEWEEAVDDARDDADIPASKGTLTTKTIDGRDYFYLQWREGSNIRSQYVAPVTPAGDE